MMRAADIHTRLGAAWPVVLAQLGIDEAFLRPKKAGPCPACGGRDRYVFDNRSNRGDYFCRHCGAGDGFQLLQRAHGWTFRETLQRVAEAAGLEQAEHGQVWSSAVKEATTEPPAKPTARVLRLRRECCRIVDCQDAIEYLAHRGLWPLPEGCRLLAHPSVEYFQDGARIGRYSALIAEVRDIAGALVTAHVTYLQHGRKLVGSEPRKILSPLTAHTGCAVRLTPLEGEALGIGEGIETCLAAAARHRVPTWAALNTSLLSKFEPPAGIKRLLIFADRDTAGLEAASRLAERVQGRVDFELRLPPEGAKDWNEVKP
jgi:putative DNA primase/helicase